MQKREGKEEERGEREKLGSICKETERRKVDGEKGNFRKYGCDLFISFMTFKENKETDIFLELLSGWWSGFM